MNDSLSFARRAIEQAVAAGRIGTPVSLRLIDHGLADHGQLEPLAVDALDWACKLFQTEIVLLFAQGAMATGQLSLQARGRQGQSILIAIGTSGAGTSLLGITLVGSRGVLAWQPDNESLPDRHVHQPSAASERTSTLLTAVRKSLAKQRTVSLTAEQPPEPVGVSALKGGPPAGVLEALKSPIGVLVVAGDGTHQEMYAASFAADPRCRLIGVSDEAGLDTRRQQLNRQMAESFGIPLFDDLDVALRRPDVQVASICAEPERRAGIILRAADAKKHLYLDKPLAAGIDQGRQIIDHVARAGVASQMFSMVHGPAARQVRAALDSGRLGELVAIHCDLFFAKGPSGAANFGQPRREQSEPERFETVEAKRELYNIGVYPLVLMHWLLGKGVRRVFATTGNYFFAEHQAADFEDFGQVSLELEGGVLASIMVGRTGWRSHASSGLHRTYLIGTAGAVCLDAHRPRIEVWADEPAWPTPKIPDDPMGFFPKPLQRAGVKPKLDWLVDADDHADVRHFVDCLAKGRPSDVSAFDAAKALETLMFAYRSAAAGQCVTIT